MLCVALGRRLLVRRAAKIWRIVRHEHHEIDPLLACLRDPPRGIKTKAIGSSRAKTTTNCARWSAGASWTTAAGKSWV